MIQARGQTFVQKLLTTRVGRAVVPGEVVEIAPDLVSSHDDTALVAVPGRTAAMVAPQVRRRVSPVKNFYNCVFAHV